MMVFILAGVGGLLRAASEKMSTGNFLPSFRQALTCSKRKQLPFRTLPFSTTKKNHLLMIFFLDGVGGFEPPKCQSQSLVPYRLATAQYMGWKMGLEPTASSATN